MCVFEAASKGGGTAAAPLLKPAISSSSLSTLDSPKVFLGSKRGQKEEEDVRGMDSLFNHAVDRVVELVGAARCCCERRHAFHILCRTHNTLQLFERRSNRTEMVLPFFLPWMAVSFSLL